MADVIAIDPGPERSALVCLESGRPTVTMLEGNDDIRKALLSGRLFKRGSVLVLEQIESFGMPVGREVFATVFWAGRFAECWPSGWTQLPRRAVKLHHCHSAKANDASIRQALIDRFGGKQKAIGLKHSPGPLYGIKADLWSALALGLTYLEMREI